MHHTAGRLGEQPGRGAGEPRERGDQEQAPPEPQHQQEPAQDQGQGRGPRHGRHRPARPGRRECVMLKTRCVVTNSYISLAYIIEGPFSDLLLDISF